jgi:hypothetical protein
VTSDNTDARAAASCLFGGQRGQYGSTLTVRGKARVHSELGFREGDRKSASTVEALDEAQYSLWYWCSSPTETGFGTAWRWVSIWTGEAQRSTKPLPSVAFNSPRAYQASKPKASASPVSPRPTGALSLSALQAYLNEIKEGDRRGSNPRPSEPQSADSRVRRRSPVFGNLHG